MKTLASKCNFTFVTCKCHPWLPLLPKNALSNISKHLQLLLMACSQELCCILLQHLLFSKFKLCLSFLLLRQQLVLNQMQPHYFFLTNLLSIYHVSNESVEKESVVNNSCQSPILQFNPIAIQVFSSHKPFCESHRVTTASRIRGHAN